MTKKLIFIFAMIFAVFSACKKEQQLPVPESSGPEASIPVMLSTKGLDVKTKAATNVVDNSIRDISIIVYSINGDYLKHFYFNSLTDVSIVTSTGTKTIVAIANAGEKDYSIYRRIEDIRSLKCDNMIAPTGEPIASSEMTTDVKLNEPIRISLDRLITKITVVFNKSRLSPDVNLTVKKIALKNVPKSCYYIQANTPAEHEVNEIGDFIETNLEPTDHLTANPLYFFENRQGENPSITHERDKIGDSKCTYLEITTDYSSPSKTGTVIYKAYLGENNTTSFNNFRNSWYRINIGFNGDALSVTPRIDKEQLGAVDYNISAAASPAEGGTVSGTGSYSYGSTPALTATPAANYTFIGWSPAITPVIGNSHYVAIFALNNTPVTDITVTAGRTFLNSLWNSTTATATVLPENATNKNVVWSSSNPSVATVSSTGYIKAFSSGTTTITATAQDGSGKSGSITITVNIPILSTSVSVSLGNNTLGVGVTTTATATVLPENATNKNVIWSSSNTSVATVFAGVVTAVNPGSATITATAQDGSGAKGSATLTVTTSTTPVSSISVSLGSANISSGSSTTATATVLPANATNKNVVWSSSNTSIATVNSSGIVTAVNPGTATITATAQDGSGKSGSATLTVTTSTTPVSSISVSLGSASIFPESFTTATATVLPENATNKNVVWSSSNTSIATVNSSGVVRAVNPGSATITATSEDGSGKSGSATIEVRPSAAKKVTSITLNQSAISTSEIGKIYTLYATSILPEDATNKNVIWSSSNTSVATVNKDNGEVITEGLGTAIITATAEDGSGTVATCSVFVYENIEVSIERYDYNTYDPETDETISRQISIYLRVKFTWDGTMENWNAQMYKVRDISSQFSIPITVSFPADYDIDGKTYQLKLDDVNNNFNPLLEGVRGGLNVDDNTGKEPFTFTCTEGSKFVGNYKVTWKIYPGANNKY